MKLTRQQVLDLLTRTKAAGHLPTDGPTSLFVAQKRGKPVQLAVTVTDSKAWDETVTMTDSPAYYTCSCGARK